MVKIQKSLLIVFVIGLFVVSCGGPSSKEFEIKGDEAKLTKNMGSIIAISNLVYDIADHVKGAMNTVINDDKLKKLKTINLRYEVKSGGDDHRGVASLIIPVAEWQQIPKEKREKVYWIASNLERWKNIIDYELIVEIRKLKKKFGY